MDASPSSGRRVTLICLCGPDGSGKTTLAVAIKRYLEGKGVRARISWIRGSHGIASLVARFLRLFAAFRGPCNPYYEICVPRGMRDLWIFLEVASAVPLYVARHVLPRALGLLVVGERCLLDFLVWLLITVGADVAKSPPARLVARLGLAEAHVCVTADLETLRRRRRPRDSLLEEQLAIYSALARSLGVAVVDTSGRGVSESLEEVIRILGLGPARGP